jgi:glycosyltransferase involved in cell wall biosynthesis
MSARRHVLVVASTFPSGPEDTVPRFVLDQVVALRRIRPEWRFTVLAPHDARSATRDRVEHPDFVERRFHYVWPRPWESLAGHGIMPAIRRNPLQLLAVPLLLWSERRAVRRILREDRPDLVYAHWFTPQALTSAGVARAAGVPLVFTTHASDVAVWARFGAVGRRIVGSVTRRTRRFTAVSRTSLERMRVFFTADQWREVLDRADVIPMGIDLPDARPLADDPHPGRQVILFMGRLAEKKGVRYLLEAFARVRAQHPAALLVIAGDGPLRGELEAQSASLRLGGDVVFAGYTSGAAKDALYRRADVCVVPSIVTSDGDAEGLPVTLLEQLAYGKPTIATDASNAGEVVASGVDALVIPSADAGAIAAALTDVLGWDPARRAAVSDAARRTAERFAWPSVAERTAAFLLDPYLAADRRADADETP